MPSRPYEKPPVGIPPAVDGHRGRRRGAVREGFLATLAVAVCVVLAKEIPKRFFADPRPAKRPVERDEQTVQPELPLALEMAMAIEVLSAEPDPAIVTDADARDRIRATGKPWKIKHTSSGIVMLLVPPGDFLMGSPEMEDGRWVSERQHKLVIRSAFYLSQHEVSKAEWEAIVGEGNRRGDFKGGALPVEQVSWIRVHDEFLARSRGFFRLPSEAEWEYACRAGTVTAYSFGDTITPEQARFERGDGPAACGRFPANPWGFHDMHWNVFEWVEDAYAEYPWDGGTEADARTAGDGSRVLRGGGWKSDASTCRSAGRNGSVPRYADNTIGFRVARTSD